MGVKRINVIPGSRFFIVFDYDISAVTSVSAVRIFQIGGNDNRARFSGNNL